MTEKIIQLIYVRDELIALSDAGEIYSLNSEKNKWVPAYPPFKQVMQKQVTHYSSGGSVEKYVLKPEGSLKEV